MTTEQKEFYDKHFTRWGEPTEYISHELRLTYRKPESIMETGEIARYDKRAAEDITMLEKYIDFLRLHREELTKRYNELITEPSVEVVKLKRQKEGYGSGKVWFYFGIYKRYIDSGKEMVISSKRYEGRQRKQVIEMFNQYCKDHPASVPELDIEKARWEK